MLLKESEYLLEENIEDVETIVLTRTGPSSANPLLQFEWNMEDINR